MHILCVGTAATRAVIGRGVVFHVFSLTDVAVNGHVVENHIQITAVIGELNLDFTAGIAGIAVVACGSGQIPASYDIAANDQIDVFATDNATRAYNDAARVSGGRAAVIVTAIVATIVPAIAAAVVTTAVVTTAVVTTAVVTTIVPAVAAAVITTTVTATALGDYQVGVTRGIITTIVALSG